MKLIVKIGNVYQCGEWEKDTYFETDEEYETTCESITQAENELKKQFHIYQISNKKNDIIVACVY